MADRLVQQDPGPTRAEHDGHFTRWRRSGVEIDQGLMHSLVNQLLQARFVE